MSYSSVTSHRSMVFDERRNQAYLRALTQTLHANSVVLDLGTGLGVHALLAAQLGARKVYAVEPSDIITVARQIAAANAPLTDKIEFLHDRIEDVALPEQVDAIVSVFTGNFLLNEDLLPSLFHARDHLLKPGGVLIPSQAMMKAVPVALPELYDEEVAIWSRPHLGLDFSAARSRASNTVLYRAKAVAKAIYLAEPASLMTLDFYTATETHCDTKITVTLTTSGVCHGWAGWFDMQVGDEWLSTAPHAPRMHWTPVFLPLDPPIDVEAGQTMTLQLVRPPESEWNWIVETAATRQEHSTFLARPLSLDAIRKQANGYRPQRQTTGDVAHFVLDQIDGTRSIQQIAAATWQQFPEEYSDIEAALDRVRRIVLTYC